MKLPYIDQISDLEGKRVLVRASLNVPVDGNRVKNTFRLDSILDTLRYLRESRAKTIVVGHLENNDEVPSLLPVAGYLKRELGVGFIGKRIDKVTHEDLSDVQEGDIVLLENLRQVKLEKANDDGFALHLASLGDIYVNESFDASHRAHASIVGVPRYMPSFFGFTFRKEIENLSRVFSPKRPFLAVFGGAKIATKLSLVDKFIGIADSIYLVGALANTIYKAEGLDVGRSLVDTEALDLGHLIDSKKVLTPNDVTVRTRDGASETKQKEEVLVGDNILDIGPESLSELISEAQDSQMVLWNGPLGNFEAGFSGGTESFASALAAMSNDAIVGGGDTVTAIADLDHLSGIEFISTGGGAMLDFLADEELPAITAVLKGSTR